MSKSQPINIPRKLASSVPPQDGPPNFMSPPISIASSFDKYCGHLDSAQDLRKHWKNHVRSFKEDMNHMKTHCSKTTNLKQSPHKNTK